MQMAKPMSMASTLCAAGLALTVVLSLSFVVAPLAIAATFGSDYPIEIMRAQIHYAVADPAAVVHVGLGVRGGE